MFRIPLATLVLILSPAVLAAEEMSFGGIEVGVTGCRQARGVLDAAGAIAAVDESAITRGPMYLLRKGAMGVGFVRSGSVLCDAGADRVAAIELTIDKNATNAVADLIARKHRTKTRHLPSLGAGGAAFVSGSGESLASIDYVHLSFEAMVLLGTRGFADQLATWQDERQRQREGALEDAF